ncbi:hypothetical protein NQ317_000066 [Molorchus minor]|uniref:Gag protein n=1 Tax=Molorchus minor TaxID=1323400 RepID=A0ABQ9JI07_9CUCU|nr:hypothetical protein NQ317_000066 [Molorchus minor]
MPNSDDIQASRSDTGHVEPYKLSEIFSVIPEYDGNKIFLQTFLNAVRCANSMAIGNQRILLTLHVKDKLRGKAAELINSRNPSTWEEIKILLETHFGDSRDLTSLIQDLQRISQQSNESALNFVSRLQTHNAKLHASVQKTQLTAEQKAAQSNLIETMTLNTLLTGLDPKLDRDQKTNVTETVSAVITPKPSDDGEDDRMKDTDNLSDSGRETPASTAASSSNKSTIFRQTPTWAPKRKKLQHEVQPQNTQPSSVASVLEKYLQTTTATNSGGNSLKQFFIAMPETAQSFPPELQIEVKSKIFRIIQEAELKCLQPRNSMQFGNVHSTGFHCNQNAYPQGPQYT